MSHGHYAILGISSDASPEEIKKAYRACVNKHRPDKDPVGNQKVWEAYKILRDPVLRKEYDALSLYGEELERLFKLSEKHQEDNNFSEAAKALKQVLIISDDNLNARIQLSFCLLFSDKYEDSLNVAKNLVKRKPEHAVCWSTLGKIWAGCAAKISLDSKKEQAFKEARNSFSAAIKIEPGNFQHYLEISACFAEEKNWGNAFLWADKAIQSYKQRGGKYPEIEALFYPIELCFKCGKFDKVPDIVKVIQNNIPDEPQLRDFAANQFIKYGNDLIGLEDLESAQHFFNAALAYNPADEKLESFCKGLSFKIIFSELQAFNEDEDILLQMRVLVDVFFQMVIEDENSGEKFTRRIYEAHESLSKCDQGEITQSINQIKSEYPLIWNIAGEMLLKFKAPARKATPSKINNSSVKNVEIVIKPKNDDQIIEDESAKKLVKFGLFLGIFAFIGILSIRAKLGNLWAGFFMVLLISCIVLILYFYSKNEEE